MDLSFLTKDKALGVGERRSYDIPLDKGTGRWFLTTLIGMMVFLAFLSMTAALALSQFASQWQTGLENKWTIEIPAISEKGEIYNTEELQRQVDKIAAFSQKIHGVQTVTVLTRDEIEELLAPWFPVTNDSTLSEALPLPLPQLIALDLSSGIPINREDLLHQIREVAPAARLDDHQGWLQQLLKLTATLRLTAFLVTFMICSAGIVALVGVIQSRMAEHKDTIELLHLMGAEDLYITRQFQRHATFVSLQAALIGVSAACLFVIGLKFYLQGQSMLFLPRFDLSPLFWGYLLCIPAATILLAALTSRWTVLRTLHRML